MVNMNWELKKAYELSINDFEIALRHTSFWEFSRRSYLTKKIKEYELKIDKMLVEANELNLDT
jgi:hypothetical protein